MNKISRLLAALFLAVFLFPLAANAYTYSSVSYTNYIDGYIVIADSITNWNMPTVSFDVSVKDDEGDITWVKAFCVEPNQGSASGKNISVPVELVTPDSITGGLQAAWLMEYAAGYTVGSYNDTQKISALQFAIWEVISEDNGLYNLYSGDFSIIYSGEDNIDILANVYLRALEQNFASADTAYLTANYAVGQSPDKQDFLLKGISAADPVPEPATMVLLGFGMIGLASLRKKFSK